MRERCDPRHCEEQLRRSNPVCACGFWIANIDDVELRDSAAWVKGSNRFVPLAAVATASNPLRYAFNEAAQAATPFAPASRHDGPSLAEGEAPGLEAFYSPAQST